MTDRGRYREVEAFDMQMSRNLSVRALVGVCDYNVVIVVGPNTRTFSAGLGSVGIYEYGSYEQTRKVPLWCTLLYSSLLNKG